MSIDDNDTSADDAEVVASAHGDGAVAASAATGGAREGAESASDVISPANRALRAVYWGTWFLVVPIVGAVVLVWALTPPSGLDRGGLIGALESFAREQPVPVGIVVLTLIEMALWSVRSRLPLARFVSAPIRADVPSGLRSPFERARLLIEEAHLLLERHAKEIARDISVRERTALEGHLDALKAEMAAETFDEEGFIEALLKADTEIDAKLGRWRKSEIREYIESILVAVAVAMALRAFVVEAFKIPSGSMIPTLQVGDHIFVNKFAYGPAIPWTRARVWNHMPPHRGDVMVFAFPEKPEQDFIKRVIALPGDTLEAKNGHPWINGWEVPHCLVGVYSYNDIDTPTGRHEGDLFVEYLEDESYLTLYDHASAGFPEYQGPFKAKAGEVWVMGDNRNNSHDSRMWWGGQGGGVPFENIRGRALFVWLSISDAGIDWSRLGAPVMGRPRLPPAMRGLEANLTKCLRDRPPLSETKPPRGGL